KRAQLERRVAQHLGFEKVLTSVGQVYPRSLDFDVLSALVQLAAAPSSFATTLRLMAGHELVTEGFKPGQVGSSAMPHKMNTRSAERINGFAVILRGYASMAGELAGDQWNEGDVSCSVVRRGAAAGAARRAALCHRGRALAGRGCRHRGGRCPGVRPAGRGRAPRTDPLTPWPASSSSAPTASTMPTPNSTRLRPASSAGS